MCSQMTLIDQLLIRTQLVGNRAGESIETFMICLPDAQVLQSMGAQAVQPTCVTITIIDDDCKTLRFNQTILNFLAGLDHDTYILTCTAVVIGFNNSRKEVVEGEATMVCAEVKPEGLRLDPFDHVSLIILTNPLRGIKARAAHEKC